MIHCNFLTHTYTYSYIINNSTIIFWWHCRWFIFSTISSWEKRGFLIKYLKEKTKIKKKLCQTNFFFIHKTDARINAKIKLGCWKASGCNPEFRMLFLLDGCQIWYFGCRVGNAACGGGLRAEWLSIRRENFSQASSFNIRLINLDWTF